MDLKARIEDLTKKCRELIAELDANPPQLAGNVTGGQPLPRMNRVVAR
jgi:hypothetical protein